MVIYPSPYSSNLFVPLIFIISLLGCFLGTIFTPPTPIHTLKSFYKNVQPWGWWDPIIKHIKTEDNIDIRNTNFISDMGNCLIGIIWQSSMILIPIYFLIRDYPKTLTFLLIFIVTTVILKFTWLDKVKQYKN